MECPYCGTELEHEDNFGRLASHQDGKILGEIFKCPKGSNGDECLSATFHVAGSFYVYFSDGQLKDGYPC